MAVNTNSVVNGGESSAVQALVSGGGIGTPMLVAKNNQTFTRNSANTVADASFTTLLSFTLPGGSLGPNGSLQVEYELQSVGANAGSIQMFIGATAISVEVTLTAAQSENRTLTFYNTAVAANKYRASSVRNGTSAAGFATATTIDTSVDQLVEFKCKWGSAQATHSISLQAFSAVVQYGA